MELPKIKLDQKKIEEMANEMAMEAIKSELKDFYTSYNSPYREAIKEHLKSKKPNIFLDLPDIIGIMNDTLSDQIDKMAHAAIANTYVPMVNDIILDVDKEVKMSDILQKYVNNSYDDFEDYSVSIDERSDYGWLTISLEGGEEPCEFTFHVKDKEKKTYHLLGLPYINEKYGETTKLTVGSKTIEMPYTRNLLGNQFISYLAGLIISDTTITIDTEYFEREWFDGCHC